MFGATGCATPTAGLIGTWVTPEPEPGLDGGFGAGLPHAVATTQTRIQMRTAWLYPTAEPTVIVANRDELAESATFQPSNSRYVRC